MNKRVESEFCGDVKNVKKCVCGGLLEKVAARFVEL